MILFIIYIEGMRVEVPITSVKFKGFQGVYPIKLLYVSNIPVILVSALTANVAFLHGCSPTTLEAPLGSNGSSQDYDTSGNPTGGLVYYISPPQGLAADRGRPGQGRHLSSASW